MIMFIIFIEKYLKYVIHGNNEEIKLISIGFLNNNPH